MVLGATCGDGGGGERWQRLQKIERTWRVRLVVTQTVAEAEAKTVTGVTVSGDHWGGGVHNRLGDDGGSLGDKWHGHGTGHGHGVGAGHINGHGTGHGIGLLHGHGVGLGHTLDDGGGHVHQVVDLNGGHKHSALDWCTIVAGYRQSCLHGKSRNTCTPDYHRHNSPATYLAAVLGGGQWGVVGLGVGGHHSWGSVVDGSGHGRGDGEQGSESLARKRKDK